MEYGIPVKDKVVLRFEEELQRILSEFREWLGPQHEPNTIAPYCKDTEDHFRWLVEAVPDSCVHDGLNLSKITSDHLRQYERFLAKSYKESTIGRKRESLRQFYRMAVERGLISTNPVSKLSPRKRPRQEEPVKGMAHNQYIDLFTAIDLDEQNAQNSRQKWMARRDKAIISLMVMHGLQVEEISKLDVTQIDFESGRSGCLTVIGRGKKQRSVFLSSYSHDVLCSWLDSRKDMNQLQQDSAAVFLAMHWTGARSRENRISTRGIRKMVDGYLQAIGAKDKGISCDALRDDFMALSLRNPELEIKEIEEFLQQSSISVFEFR